MSSQTKPFPWKCGTCREREVYPATLESYDFEFQDGGRINSGLAGCRISIPGLEVWRCRKCGEIMLGDAADARITEAIGRWKETRREVTP